MKAFSKQDQARRDRIVEELRAAATAITDAWPQLEEAVAAVNREIDRYNEVAEQARGFAEDMVNVIDAFMSEKSDRWLASEKGDAYSEWKMNIENESFDDLDKIDVPTKPDPEHADTLEGLQESPDA